MNLFKRKVKPQKATTVNDLFATDEVNGILNRIDAVKADISTMIVMYIKDDNLFYQVTEGSRIDEVIWMLEKAKTDLLNEEE